MTTPRDYFIEQLAEILPVATHKKYADAIVELFDESVGGVDAIADPKGRVVVETVIVGGAEIGLDACGNAVTVHLPGGEAA